MLSPPRRRFHSTVFFIARLAIDGVLQAIKMPNRILEQCLVIRKRPAQRRVEEHGHNEAEKPIERVQMLDAGVNMDLVGIPAAGHNGLSKPR